MHSAPSKRNFVDSRFAALRLHQLAEKLTKLQERGPVHEFHQKLEARTFSDGYNMLTETYGKVQRKFGNSKLKK